MSDFTGDMTSAVTAAFEASSTPEPASTTTTESQSASTTETPVTDVSQAAAPQAETTKQEPGPIPYGRFKEVNDKWTTASKELETLGWAKGLDQQTAYELRDFLQRSKANPLAITEQLEAVRDHPVLGPQLRSWAARTLGTRFASRPTEMPVEDAEPVADIPLDDGRKLYSEEQQHKREQWLQRRWESKIDDKLAPLATKSAATEKYVADQVYEGIRSKATADAKTELDSLSQQYPQFDEHKKDVGAVMEAHPSYTLKQAWAEVFIEKVGPKLAGQQAATVKAKVNAGTANPQRPSGATTTAPVGFRAALEQAFGVTT